MAELVRAAGGVVWRPADGGVEVLLVHRPRHDDWSLPKGKVAPGDDDDEATARREVEEETGYRAALGRELPSTHYTVDGRPKQVRYWEMRVGDGAFAPNHEVDEIAWLALPAARERLSYAHDRAVLDAFAHGVCDGLGSQGDPNPSQS